jgi:ABC-type antimicrobial peptide transport system permease subunit
VSDIRTLDDLAAADVARPRLTMLVLVAFAIIAVGVAAIGLYAVMSFGVLQRQREIGVRVALGARQRDVIRLLMSRGLTVTVIGAIVGIGCASALGQVAAALLYGVSPRDPLSMIAATVCVFVVAAIATYVPALRATRVDPVVALRRE